MGLSNSKVLITMGAGVTTGLFFYIFYGSNSKLRLKSRQSKPIMGLKNAGATCFLNSVLQALASCNHVVEWLAHKDDANRVDYPVQIPDSYARLQYPIIAVLFRAILVINREIEDNDNKFMDKVPGDIIGTLRQQGIKFRTLEEQDTFEFFQQIMGILIKEVEKSIRRQQTGSLDSILDEEDTSEVSGELISCAEVENFSLDPPSSSSVITAGIVQAVVVEDCVSSSGWSLLNDPMKSLERIVSTRKITVDTRSNAASKSPFVGLTSTQLKCLHCMHKTPLRLETFDSLTLMIPDKQLSGFGDMASTILSVNILLENYFKPTIVTQVDCVGCTSLQKRATKSAFSKSVYISRLPTSLCLHILRASWSNAGLLSKRFELVSFPEYLDVSKLKRYSDEYREKYREEHPESEHFIGNETQLRRFRDSQYRLVAVISHVGDPETGHFITFRRGPAKFTIRGLEHSNEWFCVSDESVDSVSLIQVLSTRAYMLFYEKVVTKE